MSDTVKFLSKASIVIGLTYASIVFLRMLGSFFTLNNVTGFIASMGVVFFASGFVCLYAYKKSFRFDFFMVLKNCSIAFFGVLFAFALMIKFYVTGLLPLLFAVSGFLAIGLVGIYRDRKYRKLGFCFMALSLLFLIGVPLVNVWRLPVGYGTEISPISYHTVYREYTIPLILVSVAFFLLGSILILYKKSQAMKKQNFDDTKVIEQENIKRDSTCTNQGETNGVKKFNVNFKTLGFSFMVFSQLVFIWAAIVYRSGEAWRGSVPIILNVVDYALPLGLVGVVLFVLGCALMLYEKPKRRGFFGIASGSFVLIIAAFTYAHETKITELVFDYVPVSHYINPYRDFTLPLILVSIVPFALGYILMLKKSLKKGALSLSCRKQQR